jgi:effector-binding domain-containing protein
MKYEFIEVPEMKVAFINYQGRYEEIWHYIHLLIKKLKKNALRPFIALYYDENYIDGRVEVDACVQVNQTFNLKDVKFKTIPKEKCLSYTYKGPYSNLDDIYKEMNNFMIENNIRHKLPNREIYIKGPGKLFKRSPKRYVTQILFPIIED